MITKRIISTFLAVLMLLSALTMVVGAKTEEKVVFEYNTNKYKPTMDYMTGAALDEEGNPTGEIIDTKEEKLEVMDLRYEKDGYRLYVDAYSGEVAVECIATGDVLFTNPYDVSADAEMQSTKKATMLSQFVISFADTSSGDTIKSYNSYENAVLGGNSAEDATASQIEVKHIKNGLRLEYSIGRIDSRYLVPERISAEKFHTQILEVARAAGATYFEMNQLESYFQKKDADEYASKFKDPEKAAQAKEDFLKEFPEAANGPVYAFSAKATKKEYKAVETIIKKYCPEFTFEDIDEEHLALGYTPKQMYEALFVISLEYTIDEKGLSVRVPANGIRFDESIYRIEYIEMLPYMGAGVNTNPGYTFFPDGSGTLFDFEQLAALKTETYFHGTIYGEDYALYNIGTSTPHNETVRYPVYGLVETLNSGEESERSRGFLAVIEDGDSMARLSAYHSIRYNTVVTKIVPRPYDTCNLADSISVGGNKNFNVVSPRKYTGDFTIRYLMLTDPDVEIGGGYYETSYVGMANAYREHLVDTGVLTHLTADDIKRDIPLYIETFGTIETVEKFMSIPYDTMRVLTSFDDVRTMYKQLSEAGVTNVNFVLTGYGKGGMTNDQVPYKLDWDNSVEKELKFEDLLEYAIEEGFGLYPDFDFVFAGDDELFDGFTKMSHAVKTVDDRYTSKRQYSATRQTYVNYFELAISPAYFSRFYEKITKDYADYSPIGISVSTMGDYLNSDFDEDEPYNREESKDFVEEAFSYFAKYYNNVMTSGGNAYTWKYVDYITDISIDSSRHARSAATVPFLGIVLHGYVQTAGTAVNMEGNIDYAILRSIENGAALKFILSYQNTELLKENKSTSDYYSVRYDIWFEELVSRYNEINEALHDVQLSTITKHMFIEGYRIPSANEIVQDSQSQLMDAIQQEVENAAANKEALRVILQTVRKNLLSWNAYVAETNENTAAAIYAQKAEKLQAVKDALAAIDVADEAIAAAEAAIKAAEEAENETEEADPAPVNEEEGEEKVEKPTLEKILADAQKAKETALDAFKVAYAEYKAVSEQAMAVAEEYIEKYTYAKDNFAKLEENQAYTATIRAELAAILADVADDYKALVELVKAISEAEEDADVAAAEEEYAELLGIGAVEEEAVEKDEAAEEYNKYAAANNSIVYERYSNGKEFILNFNNYAVRVEFHGVVYTVDAYGYIVIS